MARKRHTAEQIIGDLRQTEILISEGKTIIEAARHLGVGTLFIELRLCFFLEQKKLWARSIILSLLMG